ncbi:hypothetical protein [Aquimarina hainanensis]|uniref:hypothetical protein n=1 Tax=Aquimarina hainanensis TaxID=1578017 RepID=UPI00361FC697
MILLQNGIKVRFSEKDFTNNNIFFKKGSLIITKSDNKNLSNYDEVVTSLANKHQRKLHNAITSFANQGVDFGSPDVKLINKAKIAVLKGKRTSSLNYGEIWHFFLNNSSTILLRY